MTSAATSPADIQRELEIGKRRRQRREALTALLFVAPATIVTFIFGIWPVVFGFFVSLHQWRARSHTFLGINQYVRALGNAAYVLAFFIALLFFYGGYRALKAGWAEMQEGKGNFFLYLFPGYVLAVGLIGLAVGFAAQNNDIMLPGIAVTAVGGGIYWAVGRQQREYPTNRLGLHAVQTGVFSLLGLGLGVFTLFELLSDNAVPMQIVQYLIGDQYLPTLNEQVAAGFGAAAALAAIFVIRWWRGRLPDEYAYDWLRTVLQWVIVALVVVIFALGVFLISAFQYDQLAADMVKDLERAEVEAAGLEVTGLESGDFRGIYGRYEGGDLVKILVAWPQIISISLGFLLMFSAWRTWRAASRRDSGAGMTTFILLAIALAIGGWLLIGELPRAMEVGDASYFGALLITVSYALGTVPAQLALGLFLAYIMFYEIGLGRSFFRMVYFMPYVAPLVATATVFGIIFSSREYSLANRALGALGIPFQNWLLESRGVFQVLAEMIGGPEVVLPAFLAGPSLALVSIIIYNIWVFSGYNAVIFMAGLGAIPTELYEAAKVDGAGRWTAFRHITFPLLSPTTFFLTVLSVVGVFRAFSHIYVLRRSAARSTADTASVHIFVQFWQFNQWGYAAAMAFVLFGIILILTLVQNELSKERVFYG